MIGASLFAFTGGASATVGRAVVAFGLIAVILMMLSTLLTPIAVGLGMAESSIKRMFAKGDMPLSRIDEILRVLKLDFGELARRVADAQPLLAALKGPLAPAAWRGARARAPSRAHRESARRQ